VTLFLLFLAHLRYRSYLISRQHNLCLINCSCHEYGKTKFLWKVDIYVASKQRRIPVTVYRIQTVSSSFRTGFVPNRIRANFLLHKLTNKITYWIARNSIFEHKFSNTPSLMVITTFSKCATLRSTNPRKCRRERNCKPLILNFDIKWGLVVNFMPWPLSVWESAQGFSLDMMLDEPRVPVWTLWRKKNLRPFRKSKPNSSIFQPEAALAMLIKLFCFLWYTVTRAVPLRNYSDTEELIYNTQATECNSSMAPSSTPCFRFHHCLQQTWYLTFLLMDYA